MMKMFIIATNETILSRSILFFRQV